MNPGLLCADIKGRTDKVLSLLSVVIVVPSRLRSTASVASCPRKGTINIRRRNVVVSCPFSIVLRSSRRGFPNAQRTTDNASLFGVFIHTDSFKEPSDENPVPSMGQENLRAVRGGCLCEVSETYEARSLTHSGRNAEC